MSILLAVTTWLILPPPNPVAVPLFVIVAPAGTVKVSPESPNVKAVPDAGEI